MTTKTTGYGTRIREARIAAGLTQIQLMKRLRWPARSNARLSSYETEVTEPSLTDFQKIAIVCDTKPEWLAFGVKK